MLARRGDIQSFLWVGHCSYFDYVQTWLWSGVLFVLILRGHSVTFPNADVMWNYLCSTRKCQSPIDSARLGPRCWVRLSLSHRQYTTPMPLLVCKYILFSHPPTQHHFIFPCLLISRLPSRSPTSIKDASALLATHGFVIWIQNVLTPGSSVFIVSLLAGFFFLKVTASVWEELPLKRNRG